MTLQICEQKTHCERCRDREKGMKFREKFKGFIGASANFFDCPHGVEWGYISPIQPRIVDGSITGWKSPVVGRCCDAPTASPSSGQPQTPA